MQGLTRMYDGEPHAFLNSNARQALKRGVLGIKQFQHATDTRLIILPPKII